MTTVEPPSSAAPTVKDVAALAAVSPKTVSNVLRQAVPVSSGTRKRVEDAIAELGYVPNPAARGLRSGRTGIIALAMPQLHLPYAAEVTAHLAGLAHDRGFGVQLEESWAHPERALELVHLARRRIVDGVILNPLTRLQGTELTGDRMPPTVLIGEVLQDGVDAVWVDSVAAARAMTEALIASGHRRFAVVGGPGALGAETARLRLEGHLQALAAHGLEQDPRLVAPVDAWDPPAGAAAATDLLATGIGFDALVAFNDSLALGALSTLWHAGLRVPDDVSVAGFDDVADARYLTPPLTTVAFDRHAFAAAALDRLIARIEGLGGAPTRVVIPFELVVRASTRPRG